MNAYIKEAKKKLLFINMINSDKAAHEFDDAAVTKLKDVACRDKEFFLPMIDSQETGLTELQLQNKVQQFGRNEVAHEKAPAWYLQLLQAFLNPFIGILIVIAIVSLITDVLLALPGDRDYKTVIVVSIMVMLSSLLRFWQEFRSNLAAEKLKSMVITTATVLRNGVSGPGKLEIDIKELVPGDIIFLSAGDMIPADCRILQSKDLFVSQAMLTGEALPVEKRDHSIEDVDRRSPLELENCCFMGTNVVSGTAMAVAVATGNFTYFGSISKSVSGKRAETSFDKGVNSVSWLLIRFMLIMVPLIFFINGLTKGNWLQALLFGIAVAVGLTPEMLPMIVTANLAKYPKLCRSVQRFNDFGLLGCD
ncbi:HAD-IC family P-type ATPase [Flavitalea flava]